MAGLLDFIGTPEGQGLLSAAFGGLAGARRGQPLNSLGRAGLAGLSGYGGALDRQTEQAQLAKRNELFDLQLAQMRQAQADAQLARDNEAKFRTSIASPQQAMLDNAMADGRGPTVDNAARLAPVDQRSQQLWQAMNMGQIKPMEYLSAITKDDAPVKLAEGETLYSGKASGYKPLAVGKPKASDQPAAVREYEYAKGQGYGGTFEQFQLDQRKAGATNIGLPKIEVKTGESVAGQVGPMAKDSRTQAQGAVSMFDAADRIQRALDSNKVSAGPLTTQIQTVKQLVQKVGGGNDDGIRQTRQVIKSLAQMSVEARKQLQGQGQVTESEAAAVAKADSGDINDLTTGELQDLVTLTKRAAHFTAQSHKQMLDSLGANEATKGLIPFYQVRNIEPLLKHSPQLPQIGGTSALDSALQQYGVPR